MAEIDSLEIKITSEAGTAEKAIDSLVKSLGKLTSSLKFDTSSLEKLGSINGNNFKKLGEGLQSFSNAAKNLQNVNSRNFEKLAGGIERIASIDSSKLEALGKIDGNSFRGLGEGVKALSSGLQNLQGVKKSDFNRLATGIERLAAIQPGNIEVVGNALRPLAEGINILSNAKFDNKNLTTLINSLTRLSNANTGSLANVDFAALGNSIKNLATALSGADKVSQNTISMTNAIAKLASAGGNIAAVTAGLPQLSTALKNFMQDMLGASAVNPSVISLSQAIGTLASAGGKTSAAAAGLSTLATELKKFMQVMATAPAVNQNIIQMVNALARLASQGGRVGSASRDLVGGLDRTSSAMNRTKKSAFSLAAAFGKFYATYFLLIRGIKGFMRSIESTTDYIEAFNYYNVAFGKIAAEWDKDFEKYGYENAESYAESFTERMNATLGKLSGVQVNLDTGLLEETGLQNLGLNIQQITQYASQLASVTNSIGQTGEVSLAAAKSMTMLAGDISSLFNVDYQSVANNLQSGLIGQSRALYKYGIDITNATLANYAYNLGLEKSVSEMTQAEKMQLRMIAILDQSKVSWGDLANTINSPSNMLRQFTNNAKELSMVFGQLFIPVLQKVMPIINGITIALKRLLVSFAQILGINIDFESFGQGYSEMEEGADGLSESLGGVADSAKKAKAGLRAFDELKVINMPDTSAKETGGGAGAGIDLTDEILKATEEYEKVWNEAFAKMENTAQAWADKIEKALEPIKKIFQDFAIGDFFQAGKDVSALVVSITDFFADAIDKVDWYGIGKKIGDFLAGIDWFAILKSVGNLIWQALKAAFELWKGSFDAAPIETAFLTILALPGIVGFGSKLVGLIVNPFKNVLGLLSPIISGIGGLFAEGGIFGAGGLIASASAPVLVLVGAFAALAAGLGYVFATNEEVRESFFQAVSAIRDGLQPAIDFVTNTLLPDLNAGWERLMEILSPLGTFLNDMFVSIWQDMINPALTYIGETVLPTLTGAFENLWSNVLVPFGSFIGSVLEPVIKIVSDALSVMWKNVVVPLADAIGNVLRKAFEGIMEIFNNIVIPGIGAVIKVFQFLWDNVLKPIVDYLWTTYKPIFENVFKTIGNVVENLGKIFGGLIDFIVGTFTGNWEKAWEGVKNIFNGIWNGMVSITEGVVNILINGINGFLSQFDGIANSFGEIIGIDITIPKIPEVELPRFASGGITLKHTFAEIGEMNRPEAILPLSDKKAMGMVADSVYENYSGINADTGFFGGDIEGIIYTATYNAVSAAIGNSKMLVDIKDLVAKGRTVTIEQDEVGRASVNYIQGEERRLQKSLVGTY